MKKRFLNEGFFNQRFKPRSYRADSDNDLRSPDNRRVLCQYKKPRQEVGYQDGWQESRPEAHEQEEAGL